VGHEERMGDTKSTYKVLIRKPEEKWPLGIHRCRWEYNITATLILWGVEGWIFLAQDRDQWRDLVNAEMYFRVP